MSILKNYVRGCLSMLFITQLKVFVASVLVLFLSLIEKMKLM